MAKLTGTFTVKNKKGWHARPCSRIVRLFNSYPNISVLLEKVDCASIPASGNSIFELMKLGLNYGDNIRYTLHGPNDSEINILSEKLLDLNEQLAYEETFGEY